MAKSPNMPKVDMDVLTAEERALAAPIIASRGRNKGHLRASKPKTEDGKAAYIWRMLTFYLVQRRPYVCMPMLADFDIPGGREERLRIVREELEPIINKLLETVPSEKREGLKTWGRAFGYW